MADEEEHKCPEPEGGGGAPEWMVTYSDMVTLLLTFFILLVSMASMDRVKFSAASASLKSAFGTGAGSASQNEFKIQTIPSIPSTQFAPIQSDSVAKIQKRIETEIKALKIQNAVELIQRDDDTIILRLDEAVLFKPDQSRVSPEAYPLLRQIADIIRPIPMRLRIEGHTDDTLVPKGERDNWDLSIDRSVSVLRFFTKSKLLPLDRMSAVGYGYERPIVPNTSEQNRAKNRRVDFVLRANTKLGLGNSGTKAGEIPL
ncbi:MAG: flagellar motor protein MotB [Proteobacteria bacterium]|nr:flagellar motor protein MotB [Pseudomonadota bacterium]MBU1649775.1 flagellar motor protein MotB [Pseudomonadota bacterium]